MITKAEWKQFRGSRKEPDHIMISINGDACTSMAVTWRTDIQITDGYVLYRALGEKNWKSTVAVYEQFDSDMDSSNIFWAHLEDLNPDTKYEYTCGSKEYRSAQYSFKTAPKDLKKFSFLCLADVQTGDAEPPADYTRLNVFIKDILKKHPEIRFIYTAGDNTNCGQTDVQWTGLLEGMKGIMESTPLMMSMGNHDDMGFSNYFTKENKYYSEKAEFFSRQFKGSYAYNGPEDWKTANYSFDYGNAHFNAIGISGPEFVNEWLIEDTEKSDKTWKFGSHHFPICYAGADLACDDSYPMMMEGMEKFDVMFSGHEHCFSRSFPRRGENLFDKPSQGTVFYNLGSGNRNPPGTRSHQKIWNTAWYCHEEDLSMFAIADVDDDILTLTSYVEDGRIVDRCVINKADDSIEPISRAPVFNKTRMIFKGYDLGICACTTMCHNYDGIWYVPAAILFRFIGADVELSAGKALIKAYRHTAEYSIDSDIVHTDRGDMKMSARVIKGDREQLYVPVDGICMSFNIRCNYYERNNFLSFELESQEKIVPLQQY